MLLVLAGVKGPAAVTRSIGMSVPSRTTQAQPAFTASRTALRSFGARAASRATIPSTYFQAVAGADPEPGRRLGERLAFPQVDED